MRSHLQFVSEDLEEDFPDDDPDMIPGKLVAALLQSELPRHGFEIDFVGDEDWGWVVALKHRAFSLRIGCAIGLHREYHAHHCVIEPTTPYAYRWFKRIDTTETVEKLASALEAIVIANGGRDLEWMTEVEFRREYG